MGRGSALNINNATTPRVRHCGRVCPRAWAFLPSMWAHPCCSYTSTEDEPDRRYPRSFARPV